MRFEELPNDFSRIERVARRANESRGQVRDTARPHVPHTGYRVELDLAAFAALVPDYFLNAAVIARDLAVAAASEHRAPRRYRLRDRRMVLRRPPEFHLAADDR